MWPLLSCIIPTLFAYFLACNLCLFTFLMFFILSVLPFVKPIFFHLKTDNRTQTSWLHDHPSVVTKAVSRRLFLSMAISKQLNAVPYLRHKPWQLIDSWQLSMATTTGRDHTLAARLVNSWFHVCTSLTLRPVTVVFGLGTRLRVHMHRTLENGVLHNGLLPGRAGNSFIDL